MRPPLPASRLSEAYEVQEVVRQGGLSTTLRVRHRGSGELRCIDVLRPAPGPREVLERRLDAEARPLMELRHPHVARLVDAAVGDAGEACIVRENHDGVTLRRLTGLQRPTLPLAVELLRQAADALAYLHGKGRRVGDLSPEGMLLGRGPEGRPHLVLGDLGLAKDWQEEAALTAAGLFIGRLRYAAPEQFDAQGKQAAPGDIYAFGLVAYELLTGRHPIAGDSASSLIAGHLFRPPTDFGESDPEGQVPEDVRRLVLSALAKQPGERPSAAELRTSLEQIQASLPALDASELDRWIDPPRAASTAPSSKTPSPEAAAEPPDETQQLDTWLGEAHALARDEQFVEARDKVRQVLKVQPDHSMGLMLLASLEACLKIQVEESKAHETLRLPTDTVQPLEGGSQTVMLPTRTPPPRKESTQDVGSETVRIRPADVTEIVATAQATQGAGSQEPGAPASTERLDLDPLDDGKTRPLSPDLLRRITEAEPPSAAAAAPASISPAQFANGTTKLLDTRPDEEHLPESQSEPPSAPPSGSEFETAVPVRAVPPPAVPLPGTVTMPMEQIEKQKERALASMAAQKAPTAHPEPKPEPYSDPTLPSLPTMPAASKPSAAPEVAFPTSFAEVEPTKPVAARPKPAASVDDLGFGGGPSRSPVVERKSRGRSKQRPASRARGRGQGRGQGRARGRSAGGTVVMIGATIAAVLVFAIGYAIAAGVDLREVVGLGASEDVVKPSDVPPVAPEPGLLVLDAQPWAEIIQIIDPLGEDVPLRFRHTPARYEVAPGTYTVIMSSPEGEREPLELEVTSEQTTQARPEFKTLSVDEYFRLMGWR